MDTATYLDRLLAKYAGSFDITRDALVGGQLYPAYGYFFSQGEKYVLTRKANLWSVRAYEYVIFQTEGKLTEDIFRKDILEGAVRTLTEYIEPHYIRRDGKYPEKDHMVSYLTAVVICEGLPEQGVEALLKKTRFDRGYLLSMRGHSELRVAVVDVSAGKVLTNPAGRQIRRMLKDAYDEACAGARGYSELYDKQNRTGSI